MRLRTIVVVVSILLLAAFTVVNWSVFVAPTELSLVVTSFNAPLGLLMLGVIAVVVAAFAIYMAVWQGQVLLESRQHAKELERQRQLADQAEASRFTEVSTLIRGEFERMTARLATTEDALRADVREQTNSLAAVIAEMDDRLKRGGPE